MAHNANYIPSEALSYDELLRLSKLSISDAITELYRARGLHGQKRVVTTKAERTREHSPGTPKPIDKHGDCKACSAETQRICAERNSANLPVLCEAVILDIPGDREWWGRMAG